MKTVQCSLVTVTYRLGEKVRERTLTCAFVQPTTLSVRMCACMSTCVVYFVFVNVLGTHKQKVSYTLSANVFGMTDVISFYSIVGLEVETKKFQKIKFP